MFPEHKDLKYCVPCDGCQVGSCRKTPYLHINNIIKALVFLLRVLCLPFCISIKHLDHIYNSKRKRLFHSVSCRNTSVFRTWLVVLFVINEAELNTVDNFQVIQGKRGRKREKTSVAVITCGGGRRRFSVERCSYSTVGFLMLVVRQKFCLHIPGNLSCCRFFQTVFTL